MSSLALFNRAQTFILETPETQDDKVLARRKRSKVCNHLLSCSRRSQPGPAHRTWRSWPTPGPQLGRPRGRGAHGKMSARACPNPTHKARATSIHPALTKLHVKAGGRGRQRSFKLSNLTKDGADLIRCRLRVDQCRGNDIDEVGVVRATG